LSDLLLYAPFILYLVTNMDIAFYIMYASEVWLSIASTKHINLVNFNQEWHHWQLVVNTIIMDG
jgi:phosphatidylinositol kinase/protein kinase (PI-3  family)